MNAAVGKQESAGVWREWKVLTGMYSEEMILGGEDYIS